ncbi:hypothetical protein B0A55_05700 [Friedmanniomyces simplex]|uniref:Uncharacterized protein n=1 Tax=Friedmanniomyces simplex TaxID=329884 RepID=A0A4U0XIE8_9PEZI|nr:hypothetical protein B0A55_05700 [Friedmanniomyces simplex]
MFEVLQEVSHWLVTDENPPRDVDGMDHERCAALHNAIFKHGWICSGRDAEDFLPQSLPYLGLDPHLAQDGLLHPSVLAFLRSARALPADHQVHFFYNVAGLNLDYGGHDYCFPDSDHTLTLYGCYPEHAGQPDGLVYDQDMHKAIMHFDRTDELTPEQPWQWLESILTVWIEMIQRQKIVALPADVGKVSYENVADGGVRRVEGPPRDPATGAKRLEFAMEPWTIVPWATQDLEESLKLWGMVVVSIEQEMGLGESEQFDTVLDTATLDRARVPDGFARDFLSQARKPRFTFIAPGLRVPTQSDFATQPFLDQDREPANEDELPAILLFRSEALVSTRQLFWFGFRPSNPPLECPGGLYLNPCDRSYRYPQEDGCNLLLPFELTSGWARKSDHSSASQRDDLLQSGVNPYNDLHPVQLQAFLETVYRCVEDGRWEVDESGVADGIDKWRDADTGHGWADYFLPLGPGKYW